jgi:hypothetical protein
MHSMNWQGALNWCRTTLRSDKSEYRPFSTNLSAAKSREDPSILDRLLRRKRERARIQKQSLSGDLHRYITVLERAAECLQSLEHHQCRRQQLQPLSMSTMAYSTLTRMDSSFVVVSVTASFSRASLLMQL